MMEAVIKVSLEKLNVSRANFSSHPRSFDLILSVIYLSLRVFGVYCLLSRAKKSCVSSYDCIC